MATVKRLIFLGGVLFISFSIVAVAPVRSTFRVLAMMPIVVNMHVPSDVAMRSVGENSPLGLDYRPARL